MYILHLLPGFALLHVTQFICMVSFKQTNKLLNLITVPQDLPRFILSRCFLSNLLLLCIVLPETLKASTYSVQVTYKLSLSALLFHNKLQAVKLHLHKANYFSVRSENPTGPYLWSCQVPSQTGIWASLRFYSSGEVPGRQVDGGNWRLHVYWRRQMSISTFYTCHHWGLETKTAVHGHSTLGLKWCYKIRSMWWSKFNGEETKKKRRCAESSV